VQSAVTSRLTREAFSWVEPSSNADRKARAVVSMRSLRVVAVESEAMVKLVDLLVRRIER